MALCIWNGSVSTDVTVGSNWTGGTGVGGIPNTGDDIIIPIGYVTFSGITSVINGLTGTIANNINSFTRVAQSAVTLGTQGSPLIFSLQGQTSKNVRIDGTALAYISPSYASAIEIVTAPSATTTGTYGLTVGGTNNTLLLVDSGAYGSVYVGPDTTTASFTEINIYAGQIYIGSGTAYTNLKQYAGTVYDSSVGGNEFIFGGTWYYMGAGTINPQISSMGVGSLSSDVRPCTVTNLILFNQSTWYDTNLSGIYTNPIQLDGCGLTDVIVNFGKDIKITVVSI